MKKKQIKRAAFERAPWRVINIAVVEIVWPDSRTSRVDLRLQALPGTAGAVEIITEDFHTGKIHRHKLSTRKP